MESISERSLKLLKLLHGNHRELKIIILVCDPAERAYSDFLHTRKSGSYIQVCILLKVLKAVIYNLSHI